MIEATHQIQIDYWVDQCLSGRSFTSEDRESISEFFNQVAGETLVWSDWPGLGEEESFFRFHSPTLPECIEHAIEAGLEDVEDDLGFDMEYAIKKFREFMVSSDEESVGNTYFARKLQDSRGRTALLICRNEYFWQGGCDDTALTICVDTDSAYKFLASIDVVDAMSHPNRSIDVFTDNRIMGLIEAALKR